MPRRRTVPRGGGAKVSIISRIRRFAVRESRDDRQGAAVCAWTDAVRRAGRPSVPERARYAGRNYTGRRTVYMGSKRIYIGCGFASHAVGVCAAPVGTGRGSPLL